PNRLLLFPLNTTPTPHLYPLSLHDALPISKIAGCTLPLNRCSIYESKEAGRRLNAMLSMGLSRPWQDALETLTGSKQMDATAIRSEEHTSELQSRENLVCRLLLEKKKHHK